MAKLALLSLALLPFFSAPTARAESPPRLASFKVGDPGPQLLSQLVALFPVERRQDGYEVIVPEGEEGLLKMLAPRAELSDPDLSATVRATLQRYELATLRGEQRYHSFDEVQAWMRQQQNSHADIARVVNYGTSRNGKPLNALRISASPEDSPGGGPGLPQILITAATHGDELITTEVLMHLVEQLVDGNGEIDRMSRIVQSKVIYFVPVLNADGFISRNRYDGNADPNRSYPWPERPTNSPTPSIAAIVKFFHEHKIAASIDFHAFGEMIMYPWAYTKTPIAPEAKAKLHALTGKMAEANRYEYGPISEVIYIAPGSSADYYFWKQGTLGLGIEIGQSKVPNPSSFPAAFQSQEESTWRFIEGI